jgi:hypothetical protein
MGWREVKGKTRKRKYKLMEGGGGQTRGWRGRDNKKKIVILTSTLS